MQIDTDARMLVGASLLAAVLLVGGQLSQRCVAVLLLLGALPLRRQIARTERQRAAAIFTLHLARQRSTLVTVAEERGA